MDWGVTWAYSHSLHAMRGVTAWSIRCPTTTRRVRGAAVHYVSRTNTVELAAPPRTPSPFAADLGSPVAIPVTPSNVIDPPSPRQLSSIRHSDDLGGMRPCRAKPIARQR